MDNRDAEKRTVDLAQGHIDALNALEKDSTFATKAAGSAFGGSGGLFKAYKCGLSRGSGSTLR
jgi:UDP-glucose 4-epimerase